MIPKSGDRIRGYTHRCTKTSTYLRIPEVSSEMIGTVTKLYCQDLMHGEVRSSPWLSRRLQLPLHVKWDELTSNMQK